MDQNVLGKKSNLKVEVKVWKSKHQKWCSKTDFVKVNVWGRGGKRRARRRLWFSQSKTIFIIEFAVSKVENFYVIKVLLKNCCGLGWQTEEQQGRGRGRGQEEWEKEGKGERAGRRRWGGGRKKKIEI